LGHGVRVATQDRPLGLDRLQVNRTVLGFGTVDQLTQPIAFLRTPFAGERIRHAAQSTGGNALQPRCFQLELPTGSSLRTCGSSVRTAQEKTPLREGETAAAVSETRQQQAGRAPTLEA